MSTQTRTILMGMKKPLVGLVALSVGCAPIVEETREVTRPLGQEMRQELVRETLAMDVTYAGEDPRNDAEIVVSLSRNRHCEERVITRLGREEQTERHISDWTVPGLVGLVGVLAGGCSLAYMSGGSCEGSGDGQQSSSGLPTSPQTPSDEAISEPMDSQTGAILFGSIAVGAFALLSIDLLRARDSVRPLEDRVETGPPREVACGVVPAAHTEVVHHWSAGGPAIWRGQTDGEGRLRIPVAELSWLEQGEMSSAGMLVVGRVLEEVTPEPPDSWRQAKAEVQADREFAWAADDGNPRTWYVLYKRYADTSRGEEAFERYLDSVQTLLERRAWHQIDDGLIDAVEAAPTERARQRALQLEGTRALQEAHAVKQGDVRRSLAELANLYLSAVRGAADEEQAEERRREGWELVYGRAQNDVGRGALAGIRDEETRQRIDTLAATEAERQALSELYVEADRVEVEALEAEAVRLAANSRSSDEDVVNAYADAWRAAVAIESPRAAALQQAYARASLAKVEFALEQQNPHVVERMLELARDVYEGDAEVFRRTLFDLLLEAIGESTRNREGERAQRWVDMARIYALNGHEEAEVASAWMDALIELLAGGVEKEGASLVTAVREHLTGPGWGESFNSEQARAVVARKSEELRRRLARQIRLSDLQELDDVLWLAPPRIQNRSQLRALFDSPDSYLGQRALVTVRTVDALGDGGRLAESISPGGSMVIYGLGRRARGELVALVEVTGSLADSRRGGSGRIPVMRAIWVR